ncbi:MAG: N-acetylglucosamine kinase [Tenacibaculum sp.]
MILIADGGSTKVDWILLNNDKTEILRDRSEGLNPSILSEEKLRQRIIKVDSLSSFYKSIQQIHFYGAGCGTDKSAEYLKIVLQSIFTKAEIKVSEDLLAAVYASTSLKPGIVCILGTGSNSCYFDGKNIINIAPSLGYTVMDEASGNYFGKRLLRDYFYNKMPEKLSLEFKNKYDLDVDVVKNNLYAATGPNMYLASFAKFMFNFKTEDYIQQLIRKGFQEYFEYQINPFSKNKETPLYFIGSIAYYFGKILEETALKNNLNVTKIIKHPIDDLVKFHQENDI